MRPQQATFIGIGGQKCASTWLYGVFQQCPDVMVSDEKEVDFFSYYFDRGYEWYERHFDAPTTHRHRGEISPSYLIHPSAPARVADYNPGMHVFVTLRDPVNRAFSNHLHEVRKGHISGANLEFETALQNNPLYLEQGRYARYLQPWFDTFPESQIHVLFQEDIHQDRTAAAKQVTSALGLDELEDFLDLRANESVRYRNPVIGESLWKLGSFARRNGLGRVVETIKAAPGVRHLRKANREAMRDVTDPMRDDTQEALTEFFAQDVAALEKMLGRPVPWGRFSASSGSQPRTAYMPSE